MDDGRSCYLVLGILFLAFSFLFSLAASAMIGVSDAEMKEKAEDGDPRAKRLMKVMGFPDIADRIRTASFACAAFACACLYGLFAGLWLPLAGGRGGRRRPSSRRTGSSGSDSSGSRSHR